MANRSSSFDNYLHQNLREDDQLVFLHIKEALENPDLHEDDDYLYLIEAINDVAQARGKGAGLSRQGLHKILNGECVPSIQNIMAILNAIGLRFSVKQISEAVSEDGD